MTTITTHGSLDPEKLLRALSEILSDKYRTAINVSMSESALSSGDGAESTRH